MYKIILRNNKIGVSELDYCVNTLELFAKSEQELRDITEFTSSNNYSVLKVEQTSTPLKTVKEFLQEKNDN